LESTLLNKNTDNNNTNTCTSISFHYKLRIYWQQAIPSLKLRSYKRANVDIHSSQFHWKSTVPISILKIKIDIWVYYLISFKPLSYWHQWFFCAANYLLCHTYRNIVVTTQQHTTWRQVHRFHSISLHIVSFYWHLEYH